MGRIYASLPGSVTSSSVSTGESSALLFLKNFGRGGFLGEVACTLAENDE